VEGAGVLNFSELTFAIAILKADIANTEAQLRTSEFTIKENDEKITRCVEVFEANSDALRYLKTAPIVSLDEYQSLQKGLAVVSGDMVTYKAESRGAVKVRNTALATLPKMRRYLAELEDRAVNFVHPRKILPFREIKDGK
jgi:hypothetical protein